MHQHTSVSEAGASFDSPSAVRALAHLSENGQQEGKGCGESGQRARSLSPRRNASRATIDSVPEHLKAAYKALTRTLKHRSAWVFSSPVDPVALGLPDYHQVVKEPMDLGTVKSRCEEGVYLSATQVKRDVLLTFDNAVLYNGSGHDVGRMAVNLASYFRSQWSKYVEEETTDGDKRSRSQARGKPRNGRAQRRRRTSSVPPYPTTPPGTGSHAEATTTAPDDGDAASTAADATAQTSSPPAHLFGVYPFPMAPDYVNVDGAQMRMLAQNGSGSLCHCSLVVGEATAPVRHQSVTQLWYVLSGHGKLWRRFQGSESTVDIERGSSVVIERNVDFQVLSEGPMPLEMIFVSVPPWPGQREPVPVEAGPWKSPRPACGTAVGADADDGSEDATNPSVSRPAPATGARGPRQLFVANPTLPPSADVASSPVSASQQRAPGIGMLKASAGSSMAASSMAALAMPAQGASEAPTVAHWPGMQAMMQPRSEDPSPPHGTHIKAEATHPPSGSNVAADNGIKHETCTTEATTTTTKPS